MEMSSSPDRDRDRDKEREKDEERDTEIISMPSPNVYCAPHGCFHLEVIDEGVGMAAEDCKQLFKSIVQFNPNELQV
jgi:signal transduction histidine kinase